MLGGCEPCSTGFGVRSFASNDGQIARTTPRVDRVDRLATAVEATITEGTVAGMVEAAATVEAPRCHP
jgi:hypothetical protein